MAVITDAQGAVRATGRRKEAVVRVRLVQGPGEWQLNGRSLEDYFPNKVHQQLVSEPFKTVAKDEESPVAYRVIASLRGGGVSGQAGALRLAISRALTGRGGGLPSGAEEGGLPHPRRSGQGAQEVRPQEGPQGTAVQQALIGWGAYSAPMVSGGSPTLI